MSAPAFAQAPEAIRLSRQDFNAKAQKNLMLLSEGTSKKEVLRWMLKPACYVVTFNGNRSRKFRNQVLSECFVRAGKTYEIYWFVTEWKNYRLRKVIPLVFENGQLIGWDYLPRIPSDYEGYACL